MFWRKRSAADFAEEIKAHLELEADELRGEGLSGDEAQWKARREFGNVRAAQERFFLRGRWVALDKLRFELQPPNTDIVEMLCSPTETSIYNQKHAARGAHK